VGGQFGENALVQLIMMSYSHHQKREDCACRPSLFFPGKPGSETLIHQQQVEPRQRRDGRQQAGMPL
jgi:hypothetical protein